MMQVPIAEEIEQFRNQIAILMGLYLDESRFSVLAKTLQGRALAQGLDYAGYLDWLKNNSTDEIKLLARELTVTETYFMRNAAQFNAFAEVALPERLSVRTDVRKSERTSVPSSVRSTASDNKKINILSAACASGEEPYSLAITVRERCPHAVAEVAISAFDLNPAMLQNAERARYSNWSLRDLSEDMKTGWFKADGDFFVLSDSIKKAVNFESRNLTRNDPSFWMPERFDIVFCRNVLMYFSDEQTRQAVQRIARSMAPGGYLFLGHAETLRGLSNDFHLCHTHGTFYYQRKDELSAELSPAFSFGLSFATQSQTSRFQSTQTDPATLGQPTLISADVGWIEAIQGAFDRIHVLSRAPVEELITPDNALAVSEPVGRAGNQHSNPDLKPVLDSLHSEKYGHSLDQIKDLPTQFSQDPDVLLLKAVSLSHGGALAEAELVCEELLTCDEFNAGAHYVLALCREGADDMDGAIRHDQMAAYLDPRFAMPRLHLGLLARRRNERDMARDHLNQASALLHQEDAARILLFGGGFKREVLLALCKAELVTLEGLK